MPRPPASSRNPASHSTPRARLRIASLQPSITLTLERLGALDQLVACTKYCVAALPQLGNPSGAQPIAIIADSWSSTAEEILAAQPNLVLASVPYRMESLAAILKAGCPVLTLAPHTLADIYQDIHLLASIVSQPESGDALVASMLRAIKTTRQAAASQQERPRVYCEEWGNIQIVKRMRACLHLGLAQIAIDLCHLAAGGQLGDLAPQIGAIATIHPVAGLAGEQAGFHRPSHERDAGIARPERAIAIKDSDGGAKRARVIEKFLCRQGNR